MRRTLTILVFIFSLAYADEPLAFKDAKVKTVGTSKAVASAKQVQPKAEERQDTYGAPAAPAADTYGAPAAPAVDTYGTPAAPPVQDSYGSPQAPPVYEPAPAAPVQGEVGTQGYYYYYYPVASGSGGTKQNYDAPAAPSSGGGLLGGSTLLLLLLGAVVLIGGIAAAATLSGRSLTGGYSLDYNQLAYQVHNAIEIYRNLYD